MSYCLNPNCANPRNVGDRRFCQSCGMELVLGDRYRALEPLGAGGFGRTFLAVDEYLPSRPRCVIKQLFPPKPGTRHAAKAEELFQREAERLDELGQHPQIPKLLAHFIQNGYPYLIQTYVDGHPLTRELLQAGAFDEDQIRHLLRGLLPVVQFVHDHQVIHRDIKPDNIIRDRHTETLTLVDFGASKMTTASSLSKTGTVIGSAGYSAPEQVAGKATFASDLYSLGVTCIHLMTEVPPIDLYCFVEGRWLWRDHLMQSVSDDLALVIDRMIEPAISRRYAAASAVLHDLEPAQVSFALPYRPSAPMIPAATVPPQRSPWRCMRTLCEHKQAVAAIALNPRNQQFASASFDGSIRLWDVKTDQSTGILLGHTEPVVSLVFSPDGQRLISGSLDDTLRVWNPENGELLRALNDPSDSIVSLAVAVSPDGQTVVSGSDQHTIRLWHLATGRLVRTLEEPRAVTCVAISPDGRLLASGSSGNTIRLWNLYTGELLKTLEGHSRDVNAIAFSADGSILVSASSDHSVRLWNFETRKVQVLNGHHDWVKAIALSPDGTLLASGSSDHTVKLWSLPDGKLCHTLAGHTREVNAIAFTTDSQILISGSRDRTIKLWRR
ncbi:serine/threonine-protein kinase [Thermoleptolyngbya sp. C42_A2020_037]|uniref:serine/threonine-protein kinase n=1 Tax=Thermoleptolyngbya sp. C42_A2020_037 TaxID=2747799 RepID=UPI0019DE6BBB|nr:serine/threonine-protein kinase [Thermoleptolyngbya sp. C42_A2020_037]MBF2087208.1 serine/threonine protein kinase [Thermoleptolyngbya sp. C42_A2020_037]